MSITKIKADLKLKIASIKSSAKKERDDLETKYITSLSLLNAEEKTRIVLATRETREKVTELMDFLDSLDEEDEDEEIVTKEIPLKPKKKSSKVIR